MAFFKKFREKISKNDSDSKRNSLDSDLNSYPSNSNSGDESWDNLFGEEDNWSDDLDSKRDISDFDLNGDDESWDNLFGEEIEYDLKYLNDLIKASSGTLVLERDISLSQSDKMLCFDKLSLDNGNLTIDGNGHIIDGKNENIRIFIKSENITLKNFIFKNISEIEFGFFTIMVNCNLKVINCEFHDLKGQYGLAFHNFGHLEIHDSKFYNLTGSEEGGAINIQKDSFVKVSNCEFHNVSSRQGGVLMNWGSLVVEDSLFKNSYASRGGAVCVNERGADLTVVNSKFCESFSTIGGTLTNLGTLNVSDSKFIDNHFTEVLNYNDKFSKKSDC